MNERKDVKNACLVSKEELGKFRQGIKFTRENVVDHLTPS